MRRRGVTSLLRLSIAPAVAQDDKVAFRAKPLARASTPETAALAADPEEIEAEESDPKAAESVDTQPAPKE